MPAAHDIYVEQLIELGQGTPLYYPEPESTDGPVEIGDVGFLLRGRFIRLFNVTRSADDPRQRFGVPEGFEPLNMGHIFTIDSALKPGSLQSKTVMTVEANETDMRIEYVVQDQLSEDYLNKHCEAWHKFARQRHIRLSFGGIFLVTECSKTGAWASAVYSDNSKDFGISFSVGSSFVPCAPGLSVTASVHQAGPMWQRRGGPRITVDNAHPPKEHTVFFRAAHLGTRQMYRKSVLSVFMQAWKKTRRIPRKQVEPQRPPVDSDYLHFTSSSSESTSDHDTGSLDMITLSDPPDFHPADPLLAMEMEVRSCGPLPNMDRSNASLQNSDAECVVIYADTWCNPSPEASQVIEDYRQFYFKGFKTLMANLSTFDSQQLSSQDYGQVSTSQNFSSTHSSFSQDRSTTVINGQLRRRNLFP
ncbi:hypothetical protein H0H92_013485 [Tricholoma furcatifolium]|nr:hypothetical protein H0H92_013485 [Tricholoma furcatifolium]